MAEPIHTPLEQRRREIRKQLVLSQHKLPQGSVAWFDAGAAILAFDTQSEVTTELLELLQWVAKTHSMCADEHGRIKAALAKATGSAS